MAIGTGNGATIVFGTTGFVANYQRIGGLKFEVPDVPDSHLTTTGNETRRPGDLTELDDVEAEIQYDSDVQPTLKTVETITITYPVPDGLSNGATMAGTGWLKMFTTSDLANNELQIATIMVAFDGKTGPTFTAAS